MNEKHIDREGFKKKLYAYFKVYQDKYNAESKEKLWPISPKSMNLRIEDFSPDPIASITFRFTVTHEMSNLNKTMHGGCAITLVDELTTILLAVMSKPGLYSRYGVSKGLRTSFLRPIDRGSEVRAVCELVHMGRKQAFLQTKMFQADRGELCLIAEHEKTNTDPQGQARL